MKTPISENQLQNIDAGKGVGGRIGVAQLTARADFGEVTANKVSMLTARADFGEVTASKVSMLTARADFGEVTA